VTEPKSRSAVDVTVSAVIRRPIDLVAAYSSNPSNAPSWYARISEVEWKTPPPHEPGTMVAFVARFLGRELRYTYEVVEHTPRTLVMRTAEGPFPMETSYRYDPTPDGHTQMTLRNQGTPSGFSRLATPFIAAAMQRAMNKDIAALKRLLERDEHDN
jgi:hypothetical protein